MSWKRRRNQVLRRIVQSASNSKLMLARLVDVVVQFRNVGGVVERERPSEPQAVKVQIFVRPKRWIIPSWICVQNRFHGIVEADMQRIDCFHIGRSQPLDRSVAEGRHENTLAQRFAGDKGCGRRGGWLEGGRPSFKKGKPTPF